MKNASARTKTRRCITKLALTATVLSVAMLAVSSAAVADPAGGPRCTLGEAQANFQSPLVHFTSDDLANRFQCQYRMFFDGRSFTYCEDDLILGGDNVYIPYTALGWSREQGIVETQRSGIGFGSMASSSRSCARPTRTANIPGTATGSTSKSVSSPGFRSVTTSATGKGRSTDCRTDQRLSCSTSSLAPTRHVVEGTSAAASAGSEESEVGSGDPSTADTTRARPPR